MQDDALKSPVQILGELGRGGMGTTFKCRDGANRLFAAKFPHAGYSNQQLLFDEERRLSRHQGPNVVRYLGRVQRQDGVVGLATELMDGDLASLIRNSGAQKPVTVLKLLKTSVEALGQIHASGFGAHHGDLKTGNLLHKGGTTKLGDFGLARGGAGQTVMWGPHQGGTPGYMPPEGVTSQAGDVYSLGVVFAALLLGREPLVGERLRLSFPTHPKMESAINAMLSSEPTSRLTVEQLNAKWKDLEAEATAQQARTDRDNRGQLMGLAAIVIAFIGIGALLSK